MGMSPVGGRTATSGLVTFAKATAPSRTGVQQAFALAADAVAAVFACCGDSLIAEVILVPLCGLPRPVGPELIDTCAASP